MADLRDKQDILNDLSSIKSIYVSELRRFYNFKNKDYRKINALMDVIGSDKVLQIINYFNYVSENIDVFDLGISDKYF